MAKHVEQDLRVDIAAPVEVADARVNARHGHRHDGRGSCYAARLLVGLDRSRLGFPQGAFA